MSKKVLVDALRAKGLHVLAARAETGEFSDFASEHATPMIMLVHLLKSAGADDLAKRAMQGDFDHDR